MIEMKTYDIRPEYIKAIQYTGINGSQIEDISDGHIKESPVLEPSTDNPTGEYLQVKNHHDNITTIAKVGDFVVRDDEHNWYTLSERYFNLLFSVRWG